MGLRYLADCEFDPDGLLAGVVRQVGSDRIDLVDLARAGGQLRYRAARDGQLLYEARPGEFARFWIDAVTFWCDAAPVLGQAYADVLERLARLSELDRELLAERAMAVERHLRRVAERLPLRIDELQPGTDASDSVILHLWQAVQITIDLAVSACLKFNLGAPQGYADAFRRLAGAGTIDDSLADRLARAAGFRNLVAHAYDTLDMARVHRAASGGPSDLRAFLKALEQRLRT